MRLSYSILIFHCVIFLYAQEHPPVMAFPLKCTVLKIKTGVLHNPRIKGCILQTIPAF